RTPENIAQVRESVLRSPKRPAKKHAIGLQISDRNVRRILHKGLKLHPYKNATCNGVFWVKIRCYHLYTTKL
ncbi:hypothetical protein C0J52_21934, partial [Blattella germanica]